MLCNLSLNSSPIYLCSRVVLSFKRKIYMSEWLSCVIHIVCTSGIATCWRLTVACARSMKQKQHATAWTSRANSSVAMPSARSTKSAAKSARRHTRPSISLTSLLSGARKGQRMAGRLSLAVASEMSGAILQRERRVALIGSCGDVVNSQEAHVHYRHQ